MMLARAVAENALSSASPAPEGGILAELTALALRDGTITDAEHYLWPENVEAWSAWQSVQTQWQYRPSGSICGLDYAGVSAALTEIAPADRRACWDGIQHCERETLAVISEREQ